MFGIYFNYTSNLYDNIYPRYYSVHITKINLKNITTQ